MAMEFADLRGGPASAVTVAPCLVEPAYGNANCFLAWATEFLAPTLTAKGDLARDGQSEQARTPRSPLRNLGCRRQADLPAAVQPLPHLIEQAFAKVQDTALKGNVAPSSKNRCNCRLTTKNHPAPTRSTIF